jgi:hypothetical protein
MLLFSRKKYHSTLGLTESLGKEHGHWYIYLLCITLPPKQEHWGGVFGFFAVHHFILQLLTKKIWFLTRSFADAIINRAYVDFDSLKDGLLAFSPMAYHQEDILVLLASLGSTSSNDHKNSFPEYCSLNRVLWGMREVKLCRSFIFIFNDIYPIWVGPSTVMVAAQLGRKCHWRLKYRLEHEHVDIATNSCAWWLASEMVRASQSIIDNRTATLGGTMLRSIFGFKETRKRHEKSTTSPAAIRVCIWITLFIQIQNRPVVFWSEMLSLMRN